MPRRLATPTLALTALLGTAVVIACAPPQAHSWLEGVDDLNEDGTSASHPGFRAQREDIVYLTLDNDAYHRPGCRLLSNHRNKCSSRQYARRHGHRRCPICKPV